jgi:hypothetical protein
MADFRVLHLGINYKSDPLTQAQRKEIEGILDKARDWLRYTPNCWLIYTALSPSIWHKRLKERLPWITAQSYLIVAVDINERSGWLAEEVWDWMREHRS